MTCTPAKGIGVPITISLTLLLTVLASVLSNPQSAIAAGPRSAKLIYFNVPPKDGTAIATLASKIDRVILTSQTDFRDQLWQAGYGGKVFQYRLANEVEGPAVYLHASAPCDVGHRPLDNQIVTGTGEFCRNVHPHEDWFLHNGRGERLYSTWGKRIYYHMNPANTAWRAFARERLSAGLERGGFSGIHLDNVELSRYRILHQAVNADGVVRELDSEQSFQDAWAGYLAHLGEALRAKGELTANLINDDNTGSSWDAYLPHLDGAMTEAFATGYAGMTPEEWNNQLTQVEKALAGGKAVMAISQGERGDEGKQTFAFASYLLVSDNQQTYFRYSRSNAYSQFWDYDNYNVDLGAPKAARYPIDGGWRRDFDCGYVIVDPATRSGQIVRTECSGAIPTQAGAPVPITPAANDEPWIYFPETGQYLAAGFKDFWNRSGGLPVFGYPLTGEFSEHSADDEHSYTVQYFERQRFEYHPELAGSPYDVSLGRLGAEDAARRGLTASAPFQSLPASTVSDESCTFFAETGHRLCAGFRSYWYGHGLEFGDPDISFREALALFGYPISEEFVDPESGLVTQYFERARFEYHPNNPEPYKVLLGRLGADLLANR